MEEIKQNELLKNCKKRILEITIVIQSTALLIRHLRMINADLLQVIKLMNLVTWKPMLFVPRLGLVEGASLTGLTETNFFVVAVVGIDV